MNGIASAVVLPGPDADSPPPTAYSPSGSKRRQSTVSEQDVKRARLDRDASPRGRQDSISGTKAAALPTKGRERGRERRLFGAALGALSQNSATAGQKRRVEIEQRQRAQRMLEREESEQRKQDRQARREAQRWREHRRFEKVSMHIRHENLLATANFLQTRAEPRLYYKPWETTQEEDDRIRDQRVEAHDVIRRELDNFRAAAHGRHDERQRGDGYVPVDAATRSGKEYNTEASPELDTANSVPTNDSDTAPTNPDQHDNHVEDLAALGPALASNSTAGHERVTDDSEKGVIDDTDKEVMDDHGEEVVEAAEDTVIY